MVDLPPRQRAVIVLRYYEGMTEADIADVLRIRPGTVKSQSSAAMARLRLVLDEDEATVRIWSTTRRGRGEMKLEERVASALRAQTESLVPPPTDLSSIRSAAKAQSRRQGVVVSCAVCGGPRRGRLGANRDRSGPVRTACPSPRPSLQPAVTEIPPIDTRSWTTYTSDRYDLQVGPSRGLDLRFRPSRSWRSDADVANHLSRAHEAFASPLSDVRVSVWAAPLATGTSIESVADIEAWVQAYCEASGNTPCTGIHDRAVQLCLEKRDCHPGLLVAFETMCRRSSAPGSTTPTP